MGIFSAATPFDQVVDRATSENNTSDDWSQIMDICDKVKESTVGPKDCLKALSKRLASTNPRIVLQAITLLDACISNCGRKFLLEVASRDFEQELRKHMTSPRTHHKFSQVSERLRQSLKKWAEGDFKGDPQLSLIPALYAKLKQEGYDFNVHSESPKKTPPKYSNDPNVVESKQEEDDIARAIQLSLQDNGTTKTPPGSQSSSRPASTGLYSSASAALSGDVDPSAAKETQKARALYDFEAVEDNELTFKAGEIVVVQDSSDPNWWKGTNHRGEGLFPANFVTLDLAPDPEPSRMEGGKRVSFCENVQVTEVEEAGEGGGDKDTPQVTGEIDEEIIDTLLHVLHEADPTGERPDHPQLALLEEQVNAMAPTTDSELEQIDRKHAQLARLSTDLVDALGLYHQLMRDLSPGLPGHYHLIKPPGPQSAPVPGFPPSAGPGLPPQAYGAPGQFMPYMPHPSQAGVAGPPMPYPNMIPSTMPGAAPGMPPNLGQPLHISAMPGPQVPMGQTIPQPGEYPQMPPNSHDGSAGNIVPGYGHFPPSQYGPSAHPSGPPDPANVPPNVYPVCRKVQQPLL